MSKTKNRLKMPARFADMNAESMEYNGGSISLTGSEIAEIAIASVGLLVAIVGISAMCYKNSYTAVERTTAQSPEPGAMACCEENTEYVEYFTRPYIKAGIAMTTLGVSVMAGCGTLLYGGLKKI